MTNQNKIAAVDAVGELQDGEMVVQGEPFAYIPRQNADAIKAGLCVIGTIYKALKPGPDVVAVYLESRPAQTAKRADCMPSSAEERKLRRILCAGRHGTLAYMDDGEASFQNIDYMRHSINQIEAAWTRLQIDRIAATSTKPADQAEPLQNIVPLTGQSDFLREDNSDRRFWPITKP